jgi:tetratricopeptide (TPR) repeat protein
MRNFDRCFVVMPFGKKPLQGQPGKYFDFDKVFRAVIKPAIENAKLSSHRADQEMASGVIHTQMFKSLRDEALVLADLSLDNPNVYYELGVRHVMTPSGTILICRKGSKLPFDIALSRVIFYDFDGVSFDVEEAGRVQTEISDALNEAKRGNPDSPVHALLEDVIQTQRDHRMDLDLVGDVEQYQSESQETFQRIVAESWQGQVVTDRNVQIRDLLQKHERSAFGISALAQYCLQQQELPDAAMDLLKPMVFHEIHDLQLQLYRRLKDEGKLGPRHLVKYGSAISETEPSIKGAETGLQMMNEGLQQAKERLASAPEDQQLMADAAYCHYYIGNLAVWKWQQLTSVPQDLEVAIESLEKALNLWHDIGPALRPVYLSAPAHAKLLLLMRARDQNILREDSEGHAESLLKMRPVGGEPARLVSWLQWYKILILADQTAATPSDGANVKSIMSNAHQRFAQDAKLVVKGELDVGRRQYAVLRRFLEQNSDYLRNPHLMGRISRLLQRRLG